MLALKLIALAQTTGTVSLQPLIDNQGETGAVALVARRRAALRRVYAGRTCSCHRRGRALGMDRRNVELCSCAHKRAGIVRFAPRW